MHGYSFSLETRKEGKERERAKREKDKQKTNQRTNADNGKASLTASQPLNEQREKRISAPHLVLYSVVDRKTS